MRSTRIFRHGARAVSCGALLLVLGGCPKHENFPTELDVVVPPTPSSFAITVAPGTTDYDYTFEWEISDPTDVQNYRLYAIGLGPTPELLAEPAGTQLMQTFAYSLKGLQFGVSAVSTGHVEGKMVVAVAP